MDSRAVLVIVTFLPLLFAGCLNGDGALSALDGRSLATTGAYTWNDAARLIGIFAVETGDPQAATRLNESMPFPVEAFLDDPIGDARPRVWYYGFIAAGARNGTIVGVSDQGRMQEPLVRPDADVRSLMQNPNGTPVEEWLVDAPQMVEAASLRVADWRHYTDDPLARVSYRLVPAAEGFVWWLRVDHGPGKPIVNATVSAATGEVLQLDERVP